MMKLQRDNTETDRQIHRDTRSDHVHGCGASVQWHGHTSHQTLNHRAQPPPSVWAGKQTVGLGVWCHPYSVSTHTHTATRWNDQHWYRCVQVSRCYRLCCL